MIKTSLFLFQATEDKEEGSCNKEPKFLQCCIGNSKLFASSAILILTNTLSLMVTYKTGNYPRSRLVYFYFKLLKTKKKAAVTRDQSFYNIVSAILN
jgi:hypothetical protein